MMSTGRPFRLAILAFTLALVLVAGKGQGMECLITVNTSSSDQLHPDVSGDLIVWEDASDRSIHLYNLSSGTESRVADSGTTQSYPAISGSFVAWQEGAGISARNLSAGTAWEATPDGRSPAVDGNRIAWVDGTTGDLALFEEGGPGPQVLTSNSDPTNGHPSLSGDWMVWANASWPNIYRRSVSTGEEFPVASDSFGANRNPAISGDRIVWQDDRNVVYDIWLSLISTAGEGPLTAAASDQSSPAIDGTRVAWVDSGTSEIYLGLNMVSPSSPRSIIATGGLNDAPAISGDRVVWQKYNASQYDIYLYTIGSPVSCPVASFRSDTTSGMAPLAVQFTDTSGDPSITHWKWEFGDGTTSLEKNPVHSYAFNGVYGVSLTVGNTAGRNYTAQGGPIRVGPVPVVSFLANQTTGIAPLPVQFTDTSSAGPTSWSWNFGEPPASTGQNPVHVYNSPGTYTVTLAATNENGTGTLSMPGLIQVLNGMNRKATTDIGGLLVNTAGGRQEITLDTGMMNGYSFDPSAPVSFTFTPPPSSGWKMITFSSFDGVGFAMDGGILRGNLSSCSLESLDLVPGSFATGIGNHLPVSYRLDLAPCPIPAAVNATLWENVATGDDPAFRHALATKSTQFTSVMDFAYTLLFVSEGIDPAAVAGASLNLSVASSWVQGAGGGNNITVIRLGDTGLEEVLNPSAMTTDTGSGLEHFAVTSPHGLSRFALVSATGSSNLIQMGARVATQYIQGSGMGVSSSQSSSRDTTGWAQQTPPAKAPESPAATYYGEGKLDTTPAGITRAPVIVSSEDWGASLSIGAGAKALDGAGNPLALLTVRAAPAGSLPPVPGEEGIHFTGMLYDIGPDGATFDPPVTVTFTVPGDRWSPDTQYSIRSYQAATKSWEEIPTSVDPARRVASGSVSHLCFFGLFATAPAASASLAPAGEPAMATPAMQPGPVARTPMGIFTGMVGWIYATARLNLAVSVTALLVVVACLAVFARRNRLSRYRSWITLYVASLTGLLWAVFLLASGGPFWEASFILITVAGLNLIVHLLRFDRVEISLRSPDPLRA